MLLAWTVRGWGSIQEWGCIQVDTVCIIIVKQYSPAGAQAFVCASTTRRVLGIL